ncbi:unnamed protein product, partial [Cladocopium goreaui]
MHSQVKRSSSLAGMNPGGGGSASSPGATCTSFPWPRDEQGRTVLQLSVLHRHLPCAVRLLEAGADAEELRECEQRDEEIDELCSALLGAFAGAESDKSRLQSALKSLDPAERNVARTQWPGGKTSRHRRRPRRWGKNWVLRRVSTKPQRLLKAVKRKRRSFETPNRAEKK